MSKVTGITGKLCNKCLKWQVVQNCSSSDSFNAISGFTLNSRAPGGPVTFWHPIWDQKLLKLQKNCQNCKMCHFAQNVPKLSKNVQSSKSPKITKNSTFRVSQQSSWKECVRVLWECQSVNPGPDRPRILVQPSPAFSSWFQPGQGLGALPSCPEVQGECLAFREFSREVTRPRSPSQCPGMCPGEAQAMCYSSS